MRLARQHGRPLVCGECRNFPRPKVTEAMRRWWLERYSVDELRELASEAFGWD